MESSLSLFVANVEKTILDLVKTLPYLFDLRSVFLSDFHEHIESLYQIVIDFGSQGILDYSLLLTC